MIDRIELIEEQVLRDTIRKAIKLARAKRQNLGALNISIPPSSSGEAALELHELPILKLK